MSSDNNDTNIYQLYLGISGTIPPDFYTLLGVPLFEKDTAAISQAAEKRARQLGAQKTPENTPVLSRLMKEIVAARACLQDAGKKSAYDEELKVKSGISKPGFFMPDLLPDADPAPSKSSSVVNLDFSAGSSSSHSTSSVSSTVVGGNSTFLDGTVPETPASENAFSFDFSPSPSASAPVSASSSAGSNASPFDFSPSPSASAPASASSSAGSNASPFDFSPSPSASAPASASSSAGSNVSPFDFSPSLSASAPTETAQAAPQMSPQFSSQPVSPQPAVQSAAQPAVDPALMAQQMAYMQQMQQYQQYQQMAAAGMYPGGMPGMAQSVPGMAQNVPGVWPQPGQTPYFPQTPGQIQPQAGGYFPQNGFTPQQNPQQSAGAGMNFSPFSGAAPAGSASAALTGGFNPGPSAAHSGPSASYRKNSKSSKKSNSSMDSSQIKVILGVVITALLLAGIGFYSWNTPEARANRFYIQAQSCVNARNFDGGRKYIERAIELDDKLEYTQYRDSIEKKQLSYEKGQRHESARNEKEEDYF